jgi:hypothetical protein
MENEKHPTDGYSYEALTLCGSVSDVVVYIASTSDPQKQRQLATYGDAYILKHTHG